MKIKSILVLMLVCCLFLVSCTSNQVVTTLEASVDAAIAVADVAYPQDSAYLVLAGDCMSQATRILQDTVNNPSAAIQSAKILTACAAAVSSGINAPKEMQAVVAALNAFVQAISQMQAQIQFTNPRFVSAWASSPQGKVSAKKLKKIQKKLNKLLAKMNAQQKGSGH